MYELQNASYVTLWFSQKSHALMIIFKIGNDFAGRW